MKEGGMNTFKDNVVRLRGLRHADTQRGLTGRLNPDGTLNPDPRVKDSEGKPTGKLWVRVGGNRLAVQAFNVGGSSVSNTTANVPVLVAPNVAGDLQIIGPDAGEAVQRYGGAVNGPTTPQVPGELTPTVTPGTLFKPLRPHRDTGALALKVEAGWCRGVYWAGGTVDLGAHLPASGTTWVVVSFDPAANALVVSAGPAATSPYTPGQLAGAWAVGHEPVAAVPLAAGSTTFSDLDVVDLRHFVFSKAVLPSDSGNKVLATPADGSSGTAALRRLVADDFDDGIIGTDQIADGVTLTNANLQGATMDDTSNVPPAALTSGGASDGDVLTFRVNIGGSGQDGYVPEPPSGGGGGGGSAYRRVATNGAAQPQRETVNFVDTPTVTWSASDDGSETEVKAAVPDGGIGNAQLADDAVNARVLADGAVGTAQIASGVTLTDANLVNATLDAASDVPLAAVKPGGSPTDGQVVTWDGGTNALVLEALPAESSAYRTVQGNATAVAQRETLDFYQQTGVNGGQVEFNVADVAGKTRVSARTFVPVDVGAAGGNAKQATRLIFGDTATIEMEAGNDPGISERALVTAAVKAGSIGTTLLANNAVTGAKLEVVATAGAYEFFALVFDANGRFTGTQALGARAANVVFAGPASGANASPAFRALVAADIPLLTTSKLSDFTTATRALVSATSPLAYNGTTGTFSLNANGITNGFLATDAVATGNVQDNAVTDAKLSAVGTAGTYELVAFVINTKGRVTGTQALSTRAANLVFAGPASGGAAVPAFRALVAADVPTLTAAKISDFTEAAQDAVLGVVTGTAPINFTYNDAGNTATVALAAAGVNATHLADNAVDLAGTKATGVLPGARGGFGLAFARVYARVVLAASQSIPNAVAAPYQAVTWPAPADADNFGTNAAGTTMRPWTSGNATQLRAPFAGIYLVTATVMWASSAQSGTFERIANLRVNNTGAVIGEARMQVGNGIVSQTVSGQIRLAANDVVDLRLYHDTGAGLNVTAGTQMSLSLLQPV